MIKNRTVIKYISYFLVISFVLCCCAMLLSGCSKETDYDNLVIKNWNDYTAIGAGFVDKSKTNMQTLLISMLYADSNNSKAEPKLIGVKKDGSYEPIVFENENQTEKQQNLYLCGFSAFTNFTILDYSISKPNVISACYNSDQRYLLDNRTGKIYRLDKTVFTNFFTLGCYDESDDALFTMGNFKAEKTDSKILKLSIEDDRLKVETILDCSTVNFSGFCVDRYGNLFSKNGSKFVVKTDKTIQTLSGDVYKAMNGLVYLNDKVFDESGNLVDTDFVPSDNMNCSGINNDSGGTPTTYSIKQNGSSSYYYMFDKNQYVGKIFKYTFNDDLSYTFEIINLEDYETSEAVVANDRIYFLNYSTIYYCDIETGKKTEINSDYLFNRIWNDKQGNVCFSALDSNQNIINGKIDKDNNVTTTIESNGFEIVFIKSIN